MKQGVRSSEIHLVTLNRYRYSEQRSCKDLTDLIEELDGHSPQLVQDLSRHISDEARHAMWLTDLLIDLGFKVGKPPGVSYIDEFNRLLDAESYNPNKNLEDYMIAALAAINVTEKRGCEYFSAHIYALKQAEQTEENIKIRETRRSRARSLGKSLASKISCQESRKSAESRNSQAEICSCRTSSF